MERTTASKWFSVTWVILCGLLSSAWCVSAGRSLGATFDEPYFVGAGLKCWRTGTAKWLIDSGAMPLPMYVQTAWLHYVERQRGQEFDVDREFDSMLPTARLGTLPFWWLLLIYTYLAGSQLAGPWAGRLAVALLASEPNFLAHASLATADIAAAAFLMAFWVHFSRGRESGWGWRVAFPALLYAIALFSKVSALPFGVFGMAILILAKRWSDWPAANTWFQRLLVPVRLLLERSARRDILQTFGLGILFVFVLVGSDWKASPSFVKWAETLPDDAAGHSMRFLAENLTVFSNAGNAIAYQIRHNIKGHTAYLLGESWPRAVWYYFPVTLSAKLTLAMLALPLVLLLTSPRSLGNWAVAMAVLCLAFSLNCRVQTGVRFMFPLMLSATVGLSAALVHGIRTQVGFRRAVLAGAAVVVPLWAVVVSTLHNPNGLCYTNALWGGTPNGYQLYSDSNYDWGQGLPELRRWQEQHGPANVWYFGADPALRREPFHPVFPHHLPAPTVEQLRKDCGTRYLAVGTSIMHSTLDLQARLAPVIHHLRKLQPVDRTSTFLIYSVEDLQPTGSAANAPKHGESIVVER